MSTESALRSIGERIVDEAPELIPIAVRALEGLFRGEPPEKVLTQAERAIIADRSQKEFDAALSKGRRNPNTGA